jgi:hypothetical protein
VPRGIVLVVSTTYSYIVILAIRVASKSTLDIAKAGAIIQLTLSRVRSAISNY